MENKNFIVMEEVILDEKNVSIQQARGGDRCGNGCVNMFDK